MAGGGPQTAGSYGKFGILETESPRGNTNMKRRIYELLQFDWDGDALSRFIDTFIVTLIVLNVAAVILESVSAIRAEFADYFLWFETLSVAIFTVEYVLRLWSITENADYAAPLNGRLRYAFTPLALIDALAIIPFYLGFLTTDLRLLRIFRLFRIARIAKLGRYSVALQTLGTVIRNKKEELIVTIAFLLTLLTVAASMMYMLERDAQPDAFSSIPAAMWWGIATLTTVGYGDVYPVTAMGRVFGALVATIGIGMFALPAGILGSGFMEEIGRRNQSSKTCPTCGRPIEETTG